MSSPPGRDDAAEDEQQREEGSGIVRVSLVLAFDEGWSPNERARQNVSRDHARRSSSRETTYG